MERGKPLPWLVLVGCILTMASLLLVFGINLYLTGQSTDIYRSRPLANLVGGGALILGLIMMLVGYRKVE
jgi:hypothetical protein